MCEQVGQAAAYRLERRGRLRSRRGEWGGLQQAIIVVLGSPA